MAGFGGGRFSDRVHSVASMRVCIATFVLRFTRATWRHMQLAMPAEVRQRPGKGLAIDACYHRHLERKGYLSAAASQIDPTTSAGRLRTAFANRAIC